MIVLRNAFPIGLFRTIILPQLIPLQSAGIMMCVFGVACSLMMSSTLVSILVIITSQSVLKIHSAFGYFCIACLMTNILPQPMGICVSAIGGCKGCIGLPTIDEPPSLE